MSLWGGKEEGYKQLALSRSKVGLLWRSDSERGWAEEEAGTTKTKRVVRWWWYELLACWIVKVVVVVVEA